MEIFDSLLDEALESWQGVRDGLIGEVENIPKENFEFRLTPDTRTVAEVVQHVIEVALMMTGELCRPDTSFERESFPKMIKRYAPHVGQAKTKKQILSLLKNSYKESEKRFREAGEIFMLQLITRFDGKKGTRLAWLYHGIGHEMYHTGQLTAFARAIGKTPALTQMIEGS
jgi:uncharacterized damage-inducible protein DinB